MRVAWVLILLLSSGTSIARTEEDQSRCEKRLVFDEKTQQQITEYFERVASLVQEYEVRLGSDRDPFALVFTSSRAEKVFNRLSVRSKPGGSVAPSPLGLMNLSLKKTYISDPKLNSKLIQWVLNDVKEKLRSNATGKLDLQSNLLALRYMNLYLKRFYIPNQIVDKDGEPIDQDQEKEKKEEKKPSQSKSDVDLPPEYTELPDEYKPHTKDTDNKGSSKNQKQHRIAEANYFTPFFAQKSFGVIVRGAATPFQSLNVPLLQTPIGSTQSTQRELIIRTYGKQSVSLFIPPLVKPLQPSDPRAKITRTPSGTYRLEMSERLDEVRIPLVEDDQIQMMTSLLELYSVPVGFQPDEWPIELKTQVLRKLSSDLGRTEPLRVAQAISDFISTQYLYSVGPRPETDPIEAMKAGAFQCDMAAYSMVGVLRDVYKIPSRVTVGFRAKSFKSEKGDKRSYLVFPGEAHAWVEVYHGGKWHLFDPTPVKRDRKPKDQEEGKQDEYKDNPLENAQKPPPEESKSTPSQKNDEEEKSTDKSSEEEQQSNDHQKTLEENTKKREESLKDQLKKTKGSEQKDSEEQQSKEDLIDELELGSLELEPKRDHNLLIDRALRMLMQITFDTTKVSQQTRSNLNLLYKIIKRHGDQRALALYQRAEAAHVTEHPELENWVERLARRSEEQNLNKTYHELSQIREALKVYSEVLDDTGKIKKPHVLISKMDQALQVLNRLAHPDSKNIGLVQDFVKALPAVIRMQLRQEYQFESAGPNVPTLTIAEKLKMNKLADLRLLASLLPLTNFILNSTPRPEYIEVKSWERNLKKPKGRDLMPLQRFSDLTRAIRGQPGKSIEENIREGTVYVPVTRKKVQIPAGYGKEEAERITIFLYDTSGSMDGDPGEFQAGLIAAFTSQAISDTSRSGKHRHRVVIIPFDENPGKPVEVTNYQQALDVLKNYQEKMKNTNGGTNIQKAIIQAMAVIADAQKRTGEPLAAANIIVATDGQADINAEELLQKRQLIDRSTPLQTMFISIGGTNEELIKFAMDSQRMGSEQGFYREFTHDHIKEILQDARHLKMEGRKDFYTEKTNQDIPHEFVTLMNELIQLSAKFSDEVFQGSQITRAKDHLHKLEKIKWLGIKEMDRPLEDWIKKLRKFAIQPIFKDKKVLERVVHDIVTHFEKFAGVSFNSLSDNEQEELRHLVRYAAGIEDGEGNPK